MTDQHQRRIIFATSFLALAVLVGLHLWSLRRYPAPYVDEAWIIARVWRFLHTGETFGPLDVGILDRVPNEWRTIGYFSPILQSVGLLGADHATLVGPRAVSLAFGFGLLGALFFIGRALSGPLFGMLVVLLTGLSWPFFYSAHLARPDIIAAAFAYGALAIHLSNTQRRVWVEAVSGFTLCLGFDIHPNAALLGPPIVAMFLLECGLGVLRRRHFWGFVAGLAAGLVFYVANHILPDPAAYVEIMRRVGGPVHTPPLATLDLRVIAQAFVESLSLIGYCFPFSALVVLVAMLWMIVEGGRLAVRVKTITFTLILVFTLLVLTKQDFYLIWFTPALDLIVATLLFRILSAWRSRPPVSQVFAGALVVVTMVMLYGNMPNIRRDLYAEYEVAQQKINAVVGPRDSVMGRQQYWFGLTDHTFYSWEGLVHYARTHPGSRLEDAFLERKPDILIIDGGLGKFISDQHQSNLILETLRLPASEMTALLNKRGKRIAEFDSYYGPTVIFRLTWDRVDSDSAHFSDRPVQ